MTSRRLVLLLSFAGGLFSGVALVFPFLALLVIPGFGFYLYAVQKTPTTRDGLLSSFLFAFPASAAGVIWFFDVIPLSWISLPEGPLQYALVGIVFFVTALSLTIPFLLFGVCIRNLPRTWWTPLAIAISYVFCEQLRLWSFSLFFLGPESKLAPDFSIAALGYSLTENALFLPVAQAGLFGLSMLLGLVAATSVLYVQANDKKLLAYNLILVVSILGTAAAVLPPQTSSANVISVALISSRVPPGPFTNPAHILTLLTQAREEKPDLVVIPEGLGISPFLTPHERQKLYTQLYGTSTLVISSSVVRESSGNERAQLLFETGGAGVLATQDKMFFVPVGEYLPPLIHFLISFAGKENLKGYGEYLKGQPVPGSTFSSARAGSVPVGALMCSELMSPRLYHDLSAKQHTRLLVNIANNSWFHDSHVLYTRLIEIARVQALFNRQYLLVASNASPSFIVSPRGDILKESSWSAPSVLSARLSF